MITLFLCYNTTEIQDMGYARQQRKNREVSSPARGEQAKLGICVSGWGTQVGKEKRTGRK